MAAVLVFGGLAVAEMFVIVALLDRGEADRRELRRVARALQQLREGLRSHDQAVAAVLDATDGASDGGGIGDVHDSTVTAR